MEHKPSKKLLRCPSCYLRYSIKNNKQFGWYRVYFIQPSKESEHTMMILKCRKCGYERNIPVLTSDFEKMMVLKIN